MYYTIFYQMRLIEVFKIKKGVIRLGLIRSKKSYFFEYEEIKKPLQVPERLGLLKAQKKRVSY